MIAKYTCSSTRMAAVIALVLITSAPTESLAKAFPEDPRTYPVLILRTNGSGSGCILNISNSAYLVTAKHVLYNPSIGTNSPTLNAERIIVKAFGYDTNKATTERAFENNLRTMEASGEIKASPNRDVVMVRISEYKPGVEVQALVGIKFLTPMRNFSVHSYVSRMDEVVVGADVFMFGFPISLTGPIRDVFNPSEPLLRKGIVAGANLERRTIIIDCPSYHGNSGGPVVQVQEPVLGIQQFRIIGLTSRFVPFQEEWENKTFKYSHVMVSNSGYTIIEPIEIALDMAWR